MPRSSTATPPHSYVKAETDGVVAVAGPSVAASLAAHGLIDEFRLYDGPFVLGRGLPYFAAPPGLLTPIASDRVGDDAVRVICVPDRASEADRER